MPFGTSCEFADFRACVTANQAKDNPNAYCAQLLRATEASCRRHALASRWRQARKAVVPLTGATANAIARKMEPRLRRRFFNAVRQMRGRVDLELLAEAMRVEDAVRAITALQPETWAKDLEPLARLLPDVYRMAGASAATTLTSQLTLPISFDLTNPRAVEWARANSSRLIVEIIESTRDSVREIISQSFVEGIPPREAARMIRDDIIGLTDRQSMAVMNYQLELLSKGRSQEDALRLAERYAGQLLNQRALNISRTETISSSTNGQQELWRQAVDRGLLDPEKTQRRWLWAERAMKDGTFCPLCQSLDGQEVGLEEPFICPEDGESVMLPPKHPQCRCSVALSFTE